MGEEIDGNGHLVVHTCQIGPPNTTPLTLGSLFRVYFRIICIRIMFLMGFKRCEKQIYTKLVGF